MSEYKWVVENRVVREGAVALFRDKEDADRFVEESFDLRVISWETAVRRKIVKDHVPTETDLNRMAQYFYEATPGIMYPTMTMKSEIVAGLRAALTRTGFIPQPSGWTIAYLHPDCTRCEACAELAIDSAKATGENSGSWQELVPGGDGQAAVGHRAVVERAE